MVGVLLLAGAVIAAGLLVVTAPPPPRDVKLAEDVVFPDYSTGVAGLNGSNAVRFHVEVSTIQPWTQGQEQHPTVLLTAEPGSGVAAVTVTTFFLFLARPSVRGVLTGDLDLMSEVSPNSWTTVDGPLRIWPNDDVVGNDLYLTFRLSLNVDYANGSSYGYGGWNPATRSGITIVANPIYGAIAVLILAGAGSAVLLAPRWARWIGRRAASKRPPS